MSGSDLWKRIWFCSLCMILFTFLEIDTSHIKQLTICEQKSSRSLLFVSTLDGKISALDANNLGKKQWTLDLNEGPMLSSSIHRRELNNNGQWIRLIPSLNGGLYKFDGENLEAIPVSANQLLHSSFRYSDDLVFSGGREVKSYGISSTTGKILYECGINGCTNNTEKEAYVEHEVLVVQRFQQTVRAIEPQSGIERWNFSVGQHNLILIPQSDVYCKNKVPFHTLDIEIKVVIPDGLVWAINKNNPTVKLWQQKFDSPIVAIWREDANMKTSEYNLKEINLFDSKQWSWGTEFSASPAIYLGMHDRQLYIQENEELHKSLEISQNYMQHSKYPWQPYPAVDYAVRETLLSSADDNDENAVLKITDAQSTTALSVLYNSEYVNGNGFYLYSKDQLQLDQNKQCNHNDPNLLLINKEQKIHTSNDTHEEDDDTPVQIIIVSLWYWWKEVLVISITTAILVNFMLTQRLLNATVVAKDAVLPPLIVERHIETSTNNTQLSDNGKNGDFKSRYLTDFEPVDCLGKGGYGVVFEAKNKIDDCNYAIKRIALPNSKYSRERVMREVKALAKLDHQNIVRYFNAWLECPPAGWQEKHDPQWINKLMSTNSDFTTETAHSETKINNSVCINVTQTDQSSVDSACEACELNHYDSNEDSFIIFEKSQSVGSNENVININICTESSNSSISTNAVKKVSPTPSDCTQSESIIFEDTISKHSEKEKGRKRQASFSLNLNDKSNVCKSPKMFLYIQMQLCQRLSLREWLKIQSTRNYPRVLNIFQQIVDAVEYVHLQGLIHRDLKPSNIFFSFDDKIKVGDFGLVTAMTEGYDEAHTPSENEDISFKNSLHTAYVGTHLYMSPEQINGQGYNYKVDIYSLGIILFELLIPFVTEMERITTLINLRKSVFPENFNNDYPSEHKLLNMMLDENPNKRPTTLGIKAKPPLLNNVANGFNTNEDTRWHFELPQITRHSSVISNSNSDS